MRGAGHPAGERREYRYRRDACRRHGRGRARAEGTALCGAPQRSATGTLRLGGLRSVGAVLRARVNIHES